jgi:ferric-dicitrate binding protein FerR (iron transport regulator)
MKEKDYIDELLAGYFSHNLSPEQYIELKNRINVSPENREYFLAMQEIWFSSGVSGNNRFDSDKAYRRFLLRTGTKTSSGKSLIRNFRQYAAAIALLLIISYASFRQGSKQVENRFTDIVIEAPWGSRTKTFLPDGTLVWLNAGTKITYSQGFGVNDRKIRLSGEGYFEVVRNEKLPFSVATEELNVDVLGTKFDFKNYPEDEEAVVSLLEGKILVSSNLNVGESKEIMPDRKVFLNKKSGNMRISGGNVRSTVEWTNGNLFFDEELLPDIVKKLERSYDVKITLNDPAALEQLRFYGRFIHKRQSINEVLDMLASTGKLKYSIKGKEIILSP